MDNLGYPCVFFHIFLVDTHIWIAEETRTIINKAIAEETRPIINEALEGVKDDLKGIKNDLRVIYMCTSPHLHKIGVLIINRYSGWRNRLTQ